MRLQASLRAGSVERRFRATVRVRDEERYFCFSSNAIRGLQRAGYNASSGLYDAPLCDGSLPRAFYDDLFVYSHTRRAHLRYLRIVFKTLRHYKFYLSDEKVELMADRMEALGAIVSNDGIEVEPSRWESIEKWPTPTCPKDVLRFMWCCWLGG